MPYLVSLTQISHRGKEISLLLGVRRAFFIKQTAWPWWYTLMVFSSLPLTREMHVEVLKGSLILASQAQARQDLALFH